MLQVRFRKNSLSAFRSGRKLVMCLIAVCITLLLASPPSKAGPLDTIEAALLLAAKTQSARVWMGLALPSNETFVPDSVIVAYDKLIQLRTQADRVATFAQPGMFLHLVTESVMVNASVHQRNLDHTQLLKAIEIGFDASTTFTTLTSLRSELSKLKDTRPVDPNSLSGPVSRSAAMAQPQVSTPYTYTINFDNDITAGTAKGVTVVDTINTSQQNIATFALSLLTWNSELIYPISYARTSTGSFVTVPSGTLAPVPGNGQTYSYQLSSPVPSTWILTLSRADSGTRTTFTWNFLAGRSSVNWPLAPGQTGSIAFMINPNTTPSAANAANGGASVLFGGAASWITTNPWLRPGTVF